MFKSTAYQMRVYPYNGDVAPAQIDRLQSFNASPVLNREKIREIGRDGTVDWRKRNPSTSITAMQYEYGDMEFFRKITNQADSDNTITLADFSSSMFDIVGYVTDDASTFNSSIWYPKLRTSGFSINIGDPQSYIERNFNFIGEEENILEGTNKYFNYQRFVAAGGSPESITVNSPSPVADPDNSGQYLFRVVRYSGTTTTQLTYSASSSSGDNFTFTAPSTLQCTTTANDIIRVYYSANTFNTQTQAAVFTNNNSDGSALPAENATILLYVSSDNQVYKLQSASIDVSFDRKDYYEIGNTEIIQKAIGDNTVRITLGRVLDAYTIEEVLRGVSSSYGRISTRKYIDNATLRLKIYGNSTKNTFNIGYKITDISPTGFDKSVPINDYLSRSATLEADNLSISTTESVIDA